MLHVKFKRITKSSNMVAHILPADPLDPSGQMVKYSTFSEQCHAAYQITGNHECSNIVARILPAAHPPPPDPGDGVNRSTFSEHGPVACQSKGNHEMQQLGSKYFAPRPHHFPTTLGDSVKEHGYVAYQIKGNHECSNIMVANVFAGRHPQP